MREILPHGQLLKMLCDQVEAHPHCEGTKVWGNLIRVTTGDCNWTHAGRFDTARARSSPQCRAAFSEILIALQARYNIAG